MIAAFVIEPSTATDDIGCHQTGRFHVKSDETRSISRRKKDSTARYFDSDLAPRHKPSNSTCRTEALQ